MYFVFFEMHILFKINGIFWPLSFSCLPEPTLLQSATRGDREIWLGYLRHCHIHHCFLVKKLIDSLCLNRPMMTINAFHSIPTHWHIDRFLNCHYQTCASISVFTNKACEMWSLIIIIFFHCYNVNHGLDWKRRVSLMITALHCDLSKDGHTNCTNSWYLSDRWDDIDFFVLLISSWCTVSFTVIFIYRLC